MIKLFVLLINILIVMVKETNGKARKYNKPQPKKNVKKVGHAVPQVAQQLQDVVKIVRYNANIKRHTALNIINKFVEDGFIDNGNGAFVDFLWDKYTVKHNNITKEYKYDKTFVEALVKAHSDIANDSTVAIKAFIEFANID